MKCEANVVSGQASRFEAPFLWKFFSFPNLPLQSIALFPYSSERTKVHTLPTLASVLCVFGCPLLGSSHTSSHPFLNHLCHSKTLDIFIAYSPYATVSRANVSLALLPIFTQNLMFIRCSRFLSLILLATVYHGHVLLSLLLRNERLVWSVAHVNASWNMSKRV